MALVLDGDNGIVGVLATNNDGDVIFDTNTLFVDAIENRVGIGTTSPAENLYIKSSTRNTTVLVESTDQYVWTSFKDNSSTSDYTNSIGATGDNLQVISPTISLKTGTGTNTGTGTYGTERMRIDPSGIVNFAGTIQGASDAEIATSPIRTHSNTISTNTTIDANDNAIASGPLEIGDGVTLTINGNMTVV